jgi:hypothetical protein
VTGVGTQVRPCSAQTHRLLEVSVLKISCLLSVILLICVAMSGCSTTRQITSGNTNMCMNVVNHGYPQPGAPLNMKGCDPWRNQQWSFSGNGPITGVGGFCVDIEGSSAHDGARVIYTPCSGAPSQNWLAGSNGQIVGLGGKCLDIQGGVPEQGAPLVIAPCNGSPGQQWISH